jgi:glycerol-3-phosphate O-acyltransferase
VARPAMKLRLGLFARVLARVAFNRIEIDAAALDRVRELAAEGTIVYVLHQRSVIDYLMVNIVLQRKGLPLPRFASGVSALWFRPLRDIIRIVWKRIRSVGFFSKNGRGAQDEDRCAELVQGGEPVLIFVRSSRRRGWRSRGTEPPGDGPEHLRGIVHTVGDQTPPVYLVPIAIFRGAGYPKREARRSALFYIVQEVPGEAKRLLAYVWNRRHVVMTVGSELSVQTFIERHREAGEEQIVSRLTRALRGFLYSEERIVWGPPLRPRSVIRDAVLSGTEIAAVVRTVAAERRVSETAVWKQAEDAFDEMAANFDGLYFGFLAYLLKRIWPRVFSGLEIRGLDAVVACLRQHPIVLVPCHRSHIDYLVLSWIFHQHFLSPPHIAAGKNLSFWPLGPLFRGAGAFFIRRSFEGNPLYKLVFRNYLSFLIREGYTQEFFIEGGRTRTGKMLAPKLGMLSAIVNAFSQGGRDDLYLVPVSIHYGRIVEEESYKRELTGEEKERESLRSLLRARSILRQRYGTVHVTFAQPISLSDALAERKERWLANAGEPPSEAVAEETREFVQTLGVRLVREVNAVTVAGATSVSATALLAAPDQAVRVHEFLAAAGILVDLLRVQGVHFTASLQRNVAGEFRESMVWLGSQGLVQRLSDAGTEVLCVSPDKRVNLDFYKNNIIHFFLLTSLVSRALLRGVHETALRDEVWWWLDLYRREFALPDAEAFERELFRVRKYLRDRGALVDGRGVAGHPILRTTAGIVENFRQAYRTVARTLAGESEWPVTEKAALARIRRAFSVGGLLGEVSKPEANSTVLVKAAMDRFADMGFIAIAAEGRKDRTLTQGPASPELATFIQRLDA